MTYVMRESEETRAIEESMVLAFIASHPERDTLAIARVAKYTQADWWVYQTTHPRKVRVIVECKGPSDVPGAGVIINLHKLEYGLRMAALCRCPFYLLGSKDGKVYALPMTDKGGAPDVPPHTVVMLSDGRPGHDNADDLEPAIRFSFESMRAVS
jgi:hypothetical protein